MELYEYGELISILIPEGAHYAAMDSRYITLYRGKPEYGDDGSGEYGWTGDGLLGRISYWKDFIDLDYVTDPDTEKVDWSLLCEEITPKPWDEPRTIQKWAECLDAIVPYDSYSATVDGTRFELWDGIPVYDEEEERWHLGDSRLPHAVFSYPENMVSRFTRKKYEIYKFNVGIPGLE